MFLILTLSESILVVLLGLFFKQRIAVITAAKAATQAKTIPTIAPAQIPPDFL